MTAAELQRLHRQATRQDLERPPLGWRARVRLVVLGLGNLWKAQRGVWTGMDPGQASSIRIGAWRQLYRARYGRA